MNSRIRKLFWSTVLSGVGLVVISFQMRPGSMLTRTLGSGMPALTDESLGLEIEGEAEPAARDLRGGSVESTKDDAADRYYKVDGKKYVVIRGQYMEYNPKNVYTVNGERIFYKARKAELVDSSGNSIKQKIKGVAKQFEVESGMDAYKPGNVQDMMKSLQQTKKRMAERNKILRQLAND